MTQLSIHFQRLDWSVRNVIMNDPNTDWVLLVDPPPENHFPSKKVVFRIYDEHEQMLVSQGALGAEEWWRWHGQDWALSAVAQYAHAVVVCNEPNAAWDVVDEYMARWIELCNDAFPWLKTVGGNFSTGTPEPGDALLFRRSLGMADYIGFHEYWVPEMWENLDEWTGWMMWRYEQFMDYLGLDKPVLITECGCDGLAYQAMNRPACEKGWLTLYSRDYDWYLRHLGQYKRGLDDRVEVAFVYEAGPWDRWASYAIDEHLAKGIVAMNRREVDMDEPRIRVLRQKEGVVETLPIEEYVKGVVPAEVFSSWPMAVLEAQACFARSWAYYQMLNHTRHEANYDVCDTSHCQNYRPDWLRDRTDRAVEDTRGVICVDKKTGEPVQTFYSQSCGGQTENRWDPEHLLQRNDCPCQENEHERVGHGHGMCQWGAMYLWEEGPARYWQDIADFYVNPETTAWLPYYGTEWEPVPVSLEERVKRLEEQVKALAEDVQSFFQSMHTVKCNLVVMKEA